MTTTAPARTEIACESCGIVYVVACEPSGGADSDSLSRCVDCGATAFGTLDTDGGGRSSPTP